MKKFASGRLALRLGAVAVFAFVFAGHATTQDPSLKPTYGAATLKAGFEPDPYKKNLDAGGPVEANKDNLTHWVAKAPDFQLNYTAGEFKLTIYAESKADTTLLINTPDGKWVANDDGPGTGLNPLIKFAKPKSGRYDIWVGTLEKGITPPATLFITENK